MKKEMLTIEFRYTVKPINDDYSGYKTKNITIGVYDTIEEAIEEGNKVLNAISSRFEIRTDDKFKLKSLFGFPKRLVTNTCYPTKGVQYFAKITPLDFKNVSNTIDEIFKEVDIQL